MKNVIFVAPPGAGKGTFGEMLEDRLGYTSLSMGELLREEIRSGSDLGKEMDEVVSRGALVSSELVKRFMIKTFESIDLTKPFIFDGFLRKVQQAKDFEEILKSVGLDMGQIIYINVSREILEQRCLSRFGCVKCNKIYNINSKDFKPKEEGKCDICKTELTQRKDDTKEGFSKRYDSYLEETLPVLDYLKENYDILEIDGTADREMSYEKISKAIGAKE